MSGLLLPPRDYRGMPHRHLLAAGTTLWRVHRDVYEPAEFRRRPSHTVFQGGRFDSTPEDPYGYLYAALNDVTALAEALLRDVPYGDQGLRALPRARVRNRFISAIRTHGPLYLLDLSDGPALAAVAQNSLLVHADGDQYAQTRAVGRWLRDIAPWAQGFYWRSSRDHGKPTLILFEDRGAAKALEVKADRKIALDDTAGAHWLNASLAPLRTYVRPPR